MTDAPTPQQAPAVSVIVPVYNVRERIEACIKSILSSTLRDIEVIAIDDGSSDGGGEVLDALAGEDLRLRVIHQQNQGVSIARNNGIEAAAGEYLSFVDGDDGIEPDFLEKLYTAAVREDADICKGEARFVGLRGRERVTKDNAAIRESGSKLYFIFCWWTAIYRRAFINQNRIRFREHHIYTQDVLFQCQAAALCNKVFTVDDAHYLYLKRHGSADSTRLSREKQEAAILTYTLVTDNLNEKLPSLDRAGVVYVYFCAIRALAELCYKIKPLEDWDACLKAAQAIYKKCPYRKEVREMLYSELQLHMLSDTNVKVLRDRGVRVPGIFRWMLNRYSCRRRALAMLVRRLADDREYRRYRADPLFVFAHSRNPKIRYLGRFYK